MSYYLTQDAEQDIEDIYIYSLQEFDEAQAEKYYHALEDHFSRLSDNPQMGRDFSFVKAHIRRSNCGSHAVYYRVMNKQDVLILRVLHQRMDPARHLSPD